jgi:hypothetical protein
MATTLTLGDFVFADMEVPDEMALGGGQMLSIKQLIGGRRVIDALGRSDRPVEWSGIFFGPKALSRARYLDGLRIAGKALKLTVAEASLTVVIADYEYRLMAGRYPYHISCLVISDDAAPLTALSTLTSDGMINGDLATVGVLSASIGDGQLSGLVTTLGAAISKVSSFAKATTATINTVLQPISDVQARVTTLIGSTGNALSNLTSLGGVLPNNPASTMAASLTNSVVNMTQLSDLYSLRSVMGRMGKNLSSVQASGQQVVASGGADLFDLAAQAYGDPAEWSTLARANGLTDPLVPGGSTVLIPSIPDGAGGVLQP